MKNKKTTPEPSAPEPTPRGRVSIGDIVSEMQQSYLDYAMSVIVSRALPDVRDGLKPVHRRILYAMRELGLTHHAKPRKSATVVGEVLGKYHPHGDAPVYEAMVRMAQTFSFRYPLVIGQGNFGSIDGDAPAAMRYTEAKMSPIAAQLLTDIEKNTVDFMPNYDGTKREPTLLPAAFPHLLVNGSLGIAVGMATNIPPHNLTEIINGTMHLIDNPKADVDDLIQFITGPDFPTGGLIFNQKDIREAYTTGRGGIVTRGEAEIVENKKGGHQIVITSIPYQVNKSEMISKMANLVHEKKLDGIRDIRDESDRDGLRVVIDLKGDAYPQKVLNYLYKHTDLERTFHCNILALIDGIQPKTLSLRDILDEFVKSRVVVVERRTKYDLDVARRRVHILEGLSKALNNIEAVIKVIKSSKDRAAAREGLIKKFKLSEIQANAILEMRLHTLAGLERKQIEDELKEKRALAAELESLLKSPKKIRDLIKTELTDLKERYGDERRTTLVKSAAASISLEDTIPEEEHIMILTTNGYLKRVRPQVFRAQRRGGKGVIGAQEEDIVLRFVSASTHDDLLFFSSRGKVYQTKMYEIPESSRTAKGKAIQNFLSLAPGESITSVLALPKAQKGKVASLVMTTERGIMKKTSAAQFQDVRKSGIIAISLDKNDALKWAGIVEVGDELMLVSRRGNAIHFKESELREMGRSARGVRGMLLKQSDVLIGAEVITKGNKEAEMFLISENGFGKRTKVKEFKVQRRGGSGIRAMGVNAKTGILVTSTMVTGEEEFIAISGKGKTIRTTLKEMRLLSRSAQGVRIMKLESGDHIVSMTTL